MRNNEVDYFGPDARSPLQDLPPVQGSPMSLPKEDPLPPVERSLRDTPLQKVPPPNMEPIREVKGLEGERKLKAAALAQLESPESPELDELAELTDDNFIRLVTEKLSWSKSFAYEAAQGARLNRARSRSHMWGVPQRGSLTTYLAAKLKLDPTFTGAQAEEILLDSVLKADPVDLGSTIAEFGTEVPGTHAFKTDYFRSAIDYYGEHGELSPRSGGSHQQLYASAGAAIERVGKRHLAKKFTTVDRVKLEPISKKHPSAPLDNWDFLSQLGSKYADLSTVALQKGGFASMIRGPLKAIPPYKNTSEGRAHVLKEVTAVLAAEGIKEPQLGLMAPYFINIESSITSWGIPGDVRAASARTGLDRIDGALYKAKQESVSAWGGVPESYLVSGGNTTTGIMDHSSGTPVLDTTSGAQEFLSHYSNSLREGDSVYVVPSLYGEADYFSSWDAYYDGYLAHLPAEEALGSVDNWPLPLIQDVIGRIDLSEYELPSGMTEAGVAAFIDEGLTIAPSSDRAPTFGAGFPDPDVLYAEQMLKDVKDIIKFEGLLVGDIMAGYDSEFLYVTEGLDWISDGHAREISSNVLNSVVFAGKYQPYNELESGVGEYYNLALGDQDTVNTKPYDHSRLLSYEDLTAVRKYGKLPQYSNIWGHTRGVSQGDDLVIYEIQSDVQSYYGKPNHIGIDQGHYLGVGPVAAGAPTVQASVFESLIAFPDTVRLHIPTAKTVVTNTDLGPVKAELYYGDEAVTPFLEKMEREFGVTWDKSEYAGEESWNIKITDDLRLHAATGYSGLHPYRDIRRLPEIADPKQVERMQRAAVDNPDGFTIPLDPKQPNPLSGYAVSTKGVEASTPEPILQSAQRAGKKGYLGAYNVDGEVRFEHSTVIPAQHTALMVAMNNKESSIYDLKNQRTLRAGMKSGGKYYPLYNVKGKDITVNIDSIKGMPLRPNVSRFTVAQMAASQIELGSLATSLMQEGLSQLLPVVQTQQSLARMGLEAATAPSPPQPQGGAVPMRAKPTFLDVIGRSLSGKTWLVDRPGGKVYFTQKPGGVPELSTFEALEAAVSRRLFVGSLGPGAAMGATGAAFGALQFAADDFSNPERAAQAVAAGVVIAAVPGLGHGAIAAETAYNVAEQGYQRASSYSPESLARPGAGAGFAYDVVKEGIIGGVSETVGHFTNLVSEATKNTLNWFKEWGEGSI